MRKVRVRDVEEKTFIVFIFRQSGTQVVCRARTARTTICHTSASRVLSYRGDVQGLLFRFSSRSLYFALYLYFQTNIELGAAAD